MNQNFQQDQKAPLGTKAVPQSSPGPLASGPAPPILGEAFGSAGSAPTDQNRIVIELEDEANQKPPAPPTVFPFKKRGRGRIPKSESPFPRPPKLPKKKPQFCDKCGLKGKKKQFMRCRNCQTNTHPHCYEGEGKNIKPKKYLCKVCKQVQKQRKYRDKQKLRLEKYVEKVAARRSQPLAGISVEQVARILPEEGQRWVLVGKATTMVEDSLLGNRPLGAVLQELSQGQRGECFEWELQVSNFFLTFREELGFPGFAQAHFRCMIDQKYINLLHKLHSSIIAIYLKDVLEKNKTQNVKFLNDNHFFGLMAFLKDHNLVESILPLVWPQVLCHLRHLPSMARAFQSRPYLEIVQTLAMRGIGWYETLNLSQRFLILGNLVQGLYEVDNFHDVLNRKSEYMQEISKEKNQSLQILKTNQAEILELDKKLVLLTAQGVQEDPTQTKLIPKKEDRVKEEKRKRELKEIADQRQRLLEQNQRIAVRNKEIVGQLPFVTTKLHFLGFDREHREYFYFHGHEGLLIKTIDEWRVCLHGRVRDLLKELDPRGFRECNLLNSVNLYCAMVVDSEDKEIEFQVVGDLNEAESTCKVNCKDNMMELSEQVREVAQVEERFSAYLLAKRCRWGRQAEREELRMRLASSTSNGRFIAALSELHECFLFVEGLKEDVQESELEDNEEDIDKQFELNREKVRKIPIRFWGISSEKYKKFYREYLARCESTCGTYICSWLFSSIIKKYLSRKVESLPAHVEKAIPEPPRRSKLKVESDSESISVLSVESKESQVQKKGRRPSLRRSTRMRAKEQEDSERHDQTCFECREYGDVVCCDTCTRVYHQECLGLKQIPEGEWSCYKCMERLTLERTTRSKLKLVRVRQL